MIFKVLISARRNGPEQALAGFTNTDEQWACSDFEYFSTEARAKSFCEKYHNSPLDWQTISNDCMTAEVLETDGVIYTFWIYSEPGHYNTTAPPKIPSVFEPRA
jgi:hypothetical protein